MQLGNPPPPEIVGLTLPSGDRRSRKRLGPPMPLPSVANGALASSLTSLFRIGCGPGA